MIYIVYILLWTLILYLLHVLAHRWEPLRKFHRDHHSVVSENFVGKWHPSNLLLFNDTWKSTADLWITEVIPTFIFSYVTGVWGIFIFYYFWAAFLQEYLEHNKKLNIPLILTGKKHLLHHRHPYYNFGLILPMWDLIFGTYINVGPKQLDNV